MMQEIGEFLGFEIMGLVWLACGFFIIAYFIWIGESLRDLAKAATQIAEHLQPQDKQPGYSEEQISEAVKEALKHPQYLHTPE